MGLTNLSLKLYRKTLKRLRPAHAAAHWLMTRTVIPWLEKSNHFQTIPDDPFWFRLELLTNRHELETLFHLDRLIRPGMIVLDIGAHVGYYAHRYAQVVGENGRIIAFEPHPRTYHTLQQNVSRFPNVTTMQVALAESAGTAELHDYLIMSASGSLKFDESMRALQKAHTTAGDIAPRLAHDLPVETFTVQTRPVDECLEELGIQEVHVVKMDIEGAEIGALRGMRRTIKQSPQLTVVMEYNPQALRGFGLDPIGALAEVKSFGFSRVQAIEPDGALTDWTGDEPALRARTETLMANMGVVNLLLSKE